MKKKILKSILAAISLGVLSLSVLQLGTQPVKAAGCPSNPDPACDCYLADAQSAQDQYGNTWWYCQYNCACWPTGGGAEPFFIIREYDYPD